MTLFRQEAVSAQATPYLGNIRIGRRPAFSLVCTTVVLLLGGLGIFVTSTTLSRKASLTGLLVPIGGEIKVTATQAGTVSRLFVTEGAVVQEGEDLVDLVSERDTSRGDTDAMVARSIEQRRFSLRHEQDLARLQASQHRLSLDARIKSMDHERALLESEAVTLRQRLKLAQTTADSYQRLAKEGFMSPVQAQQQEDQTLELTSRLAECERNLEGLKREQGTLESEQTASEATLASTLSQTDRDLAAIDRESVENSARREALLKAPATAQVSVLDVHLGQSVVAGQTVATLLPGPQGGNGHLLRARLFAPSRSAGFLQVGDLVRIRYAAFPYQKFGFGMGHVAAVSKTPLTTSELPGEQQSSLGTEPVYRVDVDLQRQDIAAPDRDIVLKSGMALTADVELERRSILEFLLEPLLAARHEFAPRS